MTQRIARWTGWLVVVALAALVTACGDRDHMDGSNDMDRRERPMNSGTSK